MEWRVRRRSGEPACSGVERRGGQACSGAKRSGVEHGPDNPEAGAATRGLYCMFATGARPVNPRIQHRHPGSTASRKQVQFNNTLGEGGPGIQVRVRVKESQR